MGLIDRIQNGWNAFLGNRDPTAIRYGGYSYAGRLDRPRLSRGNEKTIVNAVFNRIALDVAALDIKHVRTDADGRYVGTIESGLNNCLSLEANLDQTSRAFIQDIVLTLLDKGSAAIVPVDTNIDPNKTDSYDIYTMRVGQIVEWFPREVKVRLYNDRTGKKEDIVLRKDKIGIIENPLYSVINEPNSTMQRLIRKLRLLDDIDAQAGAGKLDLIIQLPYTIKSQARRQQAEERRRDIVSQLTDSTYGIAYTDSTEHITQLNRPVENNLMKQIEFLTETLYGQLCIDQSILNGTADAKVMLNYNNRTIEPFVMAIAEELKRKFLTKTARTQGQSIMVFRDPFKLVPVNDIAEIADKFTRNCIMTSNEIRQVIGMKPSDDENADKLINNNISQPIDIQTQKQGVPIDAQYNNSVETSSLIEILENLRDNGVDNLTLNDVNDVVDEMMLSQSQTQSQ